MGCFNYRCAVSNGNILPRDQVAVVFFGNGGYRAHTMTPVFFAEYNDYGWFEEVAKESEKDFELTRRIISEWYHAGYCTTDRTRDTGLPEVDSKNGAILDEDQLNNLFRDFAVHQNNPKGGYPNRINYMMIHRGIYEELIADYKTVKNWRDITIYDSIKESLTPPPYQENMLKALPENMDEDQRKIVTTVLRSANASAVGMVQDMLGSGAHDDYKAMIHRVKKFMTLDEQVDLIGKLSVFEMKMDNYHIPWVESGSTDQEYTYKPGIEYHEMCLKHLKQKQVDWNADRDWDDEDDE